MADFIRREPPPTHLKLGKGNTSYQRRFYCDRCGGRSKIIVLAPDMKSDDGVRLVELTEIGWEFVEAHRNCQEKQEV